MISEKGTGDDMTTTDSTDIQAMALALASAKTKCLNEDCNGTGYITKYGGFDGTVPTETLCPACMNTGEVYVLGKEVRVECICRGGYWGDRLTPCARGWNPLDVRYGWDWMVALAKAGFKVRSWCVGTEKQWEFGMCAIDKEYWLWEPADTPGLAFFQAAMKALGLLTETETR